MIGLIREWGGNVTRKREATHLNLSTLTRFAFILDEDRCQMDIYDLHLQKSDERKSCYSTYLASTLVQDMRVTDRANKPTAIIPISNLLV